MANPFLNLGVPIEKEDKEQSNITSTSPSTSDNNPFNNLGENFTEPSAVRMAQYGASQETYLLGDLKRLTSAGIQSLVIKVFLKKEKKKKIKD